MKYFSYISILIIALSLSSSADLLSQVIVWDLGDTLFSRSMLSQAKNVGLLNGLRFYLQHGKGSSDLMRQSIWEVMNEYGTTCVIEKHDSLDPKGQPLPRLMRDWFSGNKTSSEVKEILAPLVTKHKNFVDELHKEMVRNVFLWMFTPALYAASWRPMPAMVEVLEKCARRRKHKLMVLSNFDAETFSFLYNNPDNEVVFKHFKPENIFVSGVERDIKPRPSFLRALLQQAGVPVYEVILIDDQLENCAAARAMGMHAIHVKNGDATHVINELRKLGMVL